MIDVSRKGNLTGIALMVSAMAFFAVEDAIIKYLSTDLPVGVILIFLGIGGTAVFLALIKINNDRFERRIVLHPAVLTRVAAELFGTIFFVTSLSLIPITLVSAIIQVNPLLVTLGAALFLGEAVGLRRWTAIIIGLIGVLVIIRPGGVAFEPAALFTVLGVVGLSIRDIATRRCPEDASTFVLAAMGFAAVIPAGVLLIVLDGNWISPNPVHILFLLGGVVIGVCGYYTITAAMRVGEVGAVTPFRYSRLIFGVALGLIFFGETLDLWTVVGTLIVVFSGLYVLWREQSLK